MKNNAAIATRKGCMETFFGFLILAIKLAAGIAIASMLLGCKHTEYIEVEKIIEKHDTTREVRYQCDSIYTRDSIYVHEWMKGDTVFRDKTKDRWNYIERTRTDTIVQKKSEYVKEPVPYPVIKYIETPLKNWQLALMVLGLASIISCGVWLWIKFFK